MAFALVFFGIYLIFFTGNISRGSNISCSLAFSYGNSHDMISFIIEIPEVEVQLLEWRVTLHLYVSQYDRTRVGKQLHTLSSHPSTAYRSYQGELRY